MFKRKPNLEEVIIIIRNTIDHFTKRSEMYEKRGAEYRTVAKSHIREGDREAARKSLRRWKNYMRFSENCMKYADGLENRIMSIEQAQSLKDLKTAFEMAGSALKSVFNQQEDLLKMIVEQQQNMREIEMSADILAESPDDFEIQDELNQLEKEIVLEETLEQEVPSHIPVVEEEKEKLPAEKHKEAA